jgi:hypothetical protein
MWPIDLTPEENDLWDVFDYGANADFERKQQAGKAQVLLYKALLARSAIPSARLELIHEAEHNIGASVSIVGMLLRNNDHDEYAALRHPHFKDHLHYLVQGPRLPAHAKEQFAAAVKECGGVTSGDYIRLAKEARRLSKTCPADRRTLGSEFYKLTFECEPNAYLARLVRDKVRT